MKLIDKDSVLSEIDSRIEKYMRLKWKPEMSDLQEGLQCKIDCLTSLKGWINNSLEVKEMDMEHLEQEVEDFCYKYDDRKEKWHELCPHDRKLLYNPTWANFAMSIAKHFYELGLKSQNKITISQQRLSVLKMGFWTGLETFNASEMTLSDAYNQGINDILEELGIKAQKGEEV